MLFTSARPSFSNPRLVFIALLAFRILNSQLVQTFFQPDEYFQSLEPAWQWVFGTGSGAWTTWEWKAQLRSSVHPLIFASAYKIADSLVTLLTTNQSVRITVLSATPRLLQSLIAATIDFYTWQLAKRVSHHSNQSPLAALALTILSPWQWFCSVRTFSNCLETALTIVALSVFPWHWFQSNEKASVGHVSTKGLNLALLCAASACILRPTNILVWIAVTGCLLYSCGFSETLRIYTSRAMVCGSSVLVITVGIDRIYYGAWTFPPLQFVYFNVLQSLAGFYGKNRPDYYFTEGIPLLLTTAIPFAAFGIWQNLRSLPAQASRRVRAGQTVQFTLIVAIAITVIVLSVISHKEVRFIYPLLPMLHVLAATPLAQFGTSVSKSQLVWRAPILGLAVAINIGIVVYISLIHQRGVIDVMHYLRYQQEARMTAISTVDFTSAPITGISVGFLMPCHSTPWRTHLIYPQTNAWALTCEPPINKSQLERLTYMDEADVFYDDPSAWIESNMDDVSTISSLVEQTSKSVIQTRPWPEYLIFFDHLAPVIETVLKGTRYKKCKRFFNTHWHDDSRRHGDVVVWCMRKWET